MESLAPSDVMQRVKVIMIQTSKQLLNIAITQTSDLWCHEGGGLGSKYIITLVLNTIQNIKGINFCIAEEEVAVWLIGPWRSWNDV